MRKFLYLCTSALIAISTCNAFATNFSITGSIPATVSVSTATNGATIAFSTITAETVTLSMYIQNNDGRFTVTASGNYDSLTDAFKIFRTGGNNSTASDLIVYTVTFDCVSTCNVASLTHGAVAVSHASYLGENAATGTDNFELNVSIAAGAITSATTGNYTGTLVLTIADYTG